MADYDDEAPDDEPAPSGAAAAGNRIWQTVRPPLEQAALNLRVWLPVLSTPDMKGRRVRYRSKDNRVGLKWNIALPKQCWQCGKTASLEPHESKRSIRCFDGAMAIISGAFGTSGALLLLWAFSDWDWPLKVAVLLTAVGAALLFVKSWKERIKITTWTCAEHAADLPPCGCVVHENELYLFAPSESLAAAAQAELQAARKRNSGVLSPASTADEDRAPPPPADAPPPPARTPGTRAELPPLKLAGEDDELSA